MRARSVHMPGAGAAEPIVRPFPLIRIAQARSDLSPSGRGEGRRGNVFDSAISKIRVRDRNSYVQGRATREQTLSRPALP